MLGLSDQETSEFIGRIAATTLVNHACWTCIVAEQPITRENLATHLADLFDWRSPGFQPLLENVGRSMVDVLGAKGFAENLTSGLS